METHRGTKLLPLLFLVLKLRRSGRGHTHSSLMHRLCLLQHLHAEKPSHLRLQTSDVRSSSEAAFWDAASNARKVYAQKKTML